MKVIEKLPIDVKAKVSSNQMLEERLKLLDRSLLEEIIETGIELLDTCDGDVDLEEDNEDCCVAGDDGQHPIWKNGVAYWHSEAKTKAGRWDEDQRFILHTPVKSMEPIRQRVAE